MFIVQATGDRNWQLIYPYWLYSKRLWWLTDPCGAVVGAGVVQPPSLGFLQAYPDLEAPQLKSFHWPMSEKWQPFGACLQQSKTNIFYMSSDVWWATPFHSCKCFFVICKQFNLQKYVTIQPSTTKVNQVFISLIVPLKMKNIFLFRNGPALLLWLLLLRTSIHKMSYYCHVFKFLIG